MSDVEQLYGYRFWYEAILNDQTAFLAHCVEHHKRCLDMNPQYASNGFYHGPIFTANAASPQTLELLMNLGYDIDQAPRMQKHSVLAASLIRFCQVRYYLGSDSSAICEMADSPGRSPLGYAASGGNVLSLDMLLQRRADVTLQNDYGRTALHGAAMHGHEVVVRKLCQAGTNKDVWGYTAADHAVLAGHCDLAAELREHDQHCVYQDEVNWPLRSCCAATKQPKLSPKVLNPSLAQAVRDSSSMELAKESCSLDVADEVLYPL